jgi:hypothetical protein
MRLLQALLIVAGWLAAAPASSAQSAYDYPWCAVYTDDDGPGGAMSCYYASYGQCMQTMSGVGGYCVRSPYYRGSGEPSRRRPQRDY